jgi:uncharacterized protein (DUF302 family)
LPTRQIGVRRLSVVSSKPFERVVSALEAAVGHPDIAAFARDLAAAKSYAEMEQVTRVALGRSGLMEFARFDLGVVLAKAKGPDAPKSLRLVVGNPLIMQAMVRHVPDAGSYAPVTLLIDERADGVHLSYDEMASLIESYGNAEALHVARDLDAKVSALLAEAAES